MNLSDICYRIPINEQNTVLDIINLSMKLKAFFASSANTGKNLIFQLHSSINVTMQRSYRAEKVELKDNNTTICLLNFRNEISNRKNLIDAYETTFIYVKMLLQNYCNFASKIDWSRFEVTLE